MTGTVHILGEGGGIFEMSLPLHESIEDRLRKGYLRRVQPDGSPYVEGDRPEGVPSLPESRPPLNAPKADWIGWAVVNGATPDQAEALTKQDLIEKYGQVEPGSGAHVAEQRPQTGSIRTSPDSGPDYTQR